jgi:hypothetical protein
LDSKVGVGRPDFDGAHNLHCAVGEVFRWLGRDGANKCGRDRAVDLVVTCSEIGDGGLGIDFEAIDALGEKAVGIELCGACDLEALARPSLLPNLRKLGRGFFGRFDCGLRDGWRKQAG